LGEGLVLLWRYVILVDKTCFIAEDHGTVLSK
jgi:hypothetical protein